MRMGTGAEYGQFCERARAVLQGVSRAPAFDINDWLSPKHRFGGVIQMIRAGASDEEISKEYPGVCGDVLRVYHKAAEGKMCRIEKTEDAKRSEAYRARYLRELERQGKKPAYRGRYV